MNVTEMITSLTAERDRAGQTIAHAQRIIEACTTALDALDALDDSDPNELERFEQLAKTVITTPKTATTTAAPAPGFKCECGAKFGTQHGLTVHRARMHKGNNWSTKPKPLPVVEPLTPTPEAELVECPDCQRPVNRGALDIHRQRAHGHTDDAPASTVPADQLALRCDSCNYATPVGSLTALRNHVADAHKRNRTGDVRQPRRDDEMAA